MNTRVRLQHQPTLNDLFEEGWEDRNISPFGSTLEERLDNSLRIAFQNINGISNNFDRVAIEELDAMDNLGIDILGLIETNINWTLEQRMKLAAELYTKFHGGRSITASLRSRKEGYQPGGTAMVARGPICGRVYRRGSDPLGRFTWMALRGKDGAGVIVVTLYRVCQNSGVTAGTSTAYLNQWKELRRMGYKNPDPRNIVLDDVSALLHEWGDRGYHPLVMMDANSDIDERNLKRFIQQHGLIDLLTHVNEGTPPRTYTRGKRRIDFPLGNMHVANAVIKSGSLAIHDGVCFSDHTLQFIDFDCKKLFNTDDITPYATYDREFKLKDTKKKEKFIAELWNIYTHQKIPERVTKLSKDFETNGPSADLVEKYQKIDYEITRAIKAAAKKSGRRDYGYQRSDRLVDAGRNVRLHKSIASCIRNKLQDYSEHIITLAEELGYDLLPFQSLTLKKARQNVTAAIKQKREIQKAASEHRILWLERMAQEAAAQTPGSDWEKILKKMISCSRSKAQNKRLTAIFRPEWSSLDYIEVPNEKWFLTEDGDELYEFDNGIFIAHPQMEEGVYDTFGVIKILPDNAFVTEVEQTNTAIYVPDPTTANKAPPSWSTIDDTSEMQEWLMKRNKRHLQQMIVEERPPTRNEFKHILAEHGTSEVADAILNGDYDTSTLQMGPEMEQFIKGLKRTDEEKKLTTPKQMTAKDFQDVMKVTDEDTSSSATGLHYTIWKAISEDNDLATMHAIMISLPFMHGFQCDRWKRVIDCMLEKKTGQRKIHIMRIICLFEADFNSALKWYFSQHIMPNAEISGLSPDQWGGRVNRSAPACAMRKLITWEYARFTKTVMASFFGDLQANFDCIMPDMSSLVCQKKGMTKEAAYARASTMGNLSRQVRVATGTSTETYSHDPGQPSLPGEGQGKADSMALWTLISSEILKVHSTMCHGVEMIDVTGTISSRRVDDAYVDDTDTYATAPETNSTDEAIENLTNHTQIWTMLVAATGGLLAFHKCMWQILVWIRVGGEYLMASNRNIKGDLFLKDQKGYSHKIKRLEATKPNPGLGFLICPTAAQRFEFEKRLQQARDTAAQVSTSTLTTADAWLGLITRALPRITYPLCLTRFTKKQLKQLSIAIDNAFLPKLTINRNTPRIILYAPEEFGGISFPSMETTQDQKGISLFLRQLQWNQEIATDLRIVLSHAQMDSGFVTPLMESTITASFIEEGHIRHLHERLVDLRGSIIIKNQWSPQLQRMYDQSIMETLCLLPGVTKRQLQKANHCRKWIRVITIAELASIDGKTIPANRFTGRWRARSNLKWQRQPMPTEGMWKTFRQLIKRAFCSKSRYFSTTLPVPLDKPLGKWLNTTRHVEYNEYRTRTRIFIRDNNQFKRYIEQSNANHFAQDNLAPTRDSIPNESHPIETYMSNGKLFSHHNYYMQVVDENEEESNDDSVKITEMQHVNEATSIIAVTDSSVDNFTGEGTFNWRITTWNRSGLITKSAFVTGNPKYMNSYRGEMAGILDLIQYLDTAGYHTKTITLCCDNQSCITVLNDEYFSLTDLDQPESDLIREIKELLPKFENLTLKWIRGHQDDDTPYEELSLESQLNIECDLAAKHHLRYATKPTTKPVALAGMQATLYLGGHPVTTELNKQIQLATQTERMMNYVADKFMWTDNQTRATVNWRAMGIGKKRLKLHQSIRITKMLYEWTNVGKQKGKMGEDDTCPCCGKEKEDQLHLYRCTNEAMQECITNAISQFQTKMVKEGFTTPVYTAIIQLICKASNKPTITNHEITCENTLACIEAQECLGTEAFLRGFHHVDWIKLLRDTWIPPPEPPPGEKKQRRKEPLEQSVTMIRGVWNIFEAIWECRNNILHSKDSQLIERSKESITRKLLEYKSKNLTLLRRCDRFIIDGYSVREVIRWPLPRKKAMLDLLDELNKVYQEEIKHDKALYRDIRKFIEKPTSDETPLASSQEELATPKQPTSRQKRKTVRKQTKAKVQRNQDIRKFFQDNTLDTTPTASGNQEPAPSAPIHSQTPSASDFEDNE